MRQKICLSLIVAALLCAQPVLAKDKAKAKKETAKPSQKTSAEAARQGKEALIAGVNNMRNQEIRVAVLQQLLNEEIAKLRNIQEAFCKQFKLDVEKFRQGLYRYDEQQGKFVIPENKPGQ